MAAAFAERKSTPRRKLGANWLATANVCSTCEPLKYKGTVTCPTRSISAPFAEIRGAQFVEFEGKMRNFK